MKTIFQLVAELQARDQSGALCTIIETKGSTPRHETSKMLVYPDGTFTGTVGGGEVESRTIAEALEAIKEGKPRLLRYSMVDPGRGDPGICGGTLEIFVEPILSKPVLVIIGAGHVGKSLAHLAKWLGFKVVLSDDRADLCNAEIVPEADEYFPVGMKEFAAAFPINGQTYIVLVTRGSLIDIEGLPELLKSDAKYIGIIGSKRRWINTQKGLLEKGISREQLSRVYSPIGMDIGAETPEEIAVSIMAEILAVKKGASGNTMKMEPLGEK